jgi:hypothetical protein
MCSFLFSGSVFRCLRPNGHKHRSLCSFLPGVYRLKHEQFDGRDDMPTVSFGDGLYLLKYVVAKFHAVLLLLSVA